MKKILPLLALLIAVSVHAQDVPAKTKTKTKIDLSNRANDHFMIQLGALNWSGKPDSLKTKGLSKSLNVYLMMDFPFKTNPHLSMAFGPGIASDQMLFSKTHVGIKDNTPTILFTNQADTNHFKKTKLSTVYLEAPVEFRYSANPATGNGFKFAVGVKVGTMMSAHTRNVKFEDKSNTTINDYVMKENSKRFFNKNCISLMGRIGYGHITLYGSYQVTALFKDGFGPVVKPYSIGLTLSGL
jgi:hypothetical protein